MIHRQIERRFKWGWLRGESTGINIKSIHLLEAFEMNKYTRPYLGLIETLKYGIVI